jgi:hypothetical protein
MWPHIHHETQLRFYYAFRERRVLFTSLGNLLMRVAQRSTPRDISRRALSATSLRCAVVFVASVFVASCGGGSGGNEQSEIQLTFVTQPSNTTALAVMVPPVEVTVTDTSNEPRDGIVSISIDSNYCGASLSGTLGVATANGVATFPDLVVNLTADGYRLQASFESATVTSAPFSVASGVVGETLTEHAAVCLTPTEQQDAGSLAYVPEDDTLWTADDNLPGVHVLARNTGAFLDTIRVDEFVTAFPDAALCDDGDGNPATLCSYTNEFEVVAFDSASDSLYVINTVNDPTVIPPVNKPAIFRLVRDNCATCFVFDDWRALPVGLAYNGAVVIGGQLVVADGELLYAYDFTSNAIGNLLIDLPRNVRGLAFDGTSLWVQYNDELGKHEWPSGAELARHDLNVFSVDDPSGLEVVGETIYLLEGHGGNPILRFTETPTP